MSLTAVQLQDPSVELRQSWRHLLIVWAVSLTQPILGSTYYLLGAASSTDPLRQQFRLISGLASELDGLDSGSALVPLVFRPFYRIQVVFRVRIRNLSFVGYLYFVESFL